ncbi:MAG: SCO family protein [Verrucomicrobiota bacterium]
MDSVSNSPPPPAPRFQPWSIWLIVGIIVGGAVVAWNYAIFRQNQAVRQANDPRPAYKDRIEKNLNALNSKGEAIEMADLRGSVYVASQVFTRCPGQCAGVAEQLRQVHEKFGDNPRFKIVTFTIDPAHDGPEELAAFRDTFQLEGENWWFLTGEEEEVREYAFDQFKFRVEDKPEEDRLTPGDLFNHDTKVVLVDGQANIRGWYDAFIEESMKALFQDIEDVLAEDHDTAQRGVYLMVIAIVAVILAFVIIFGIRNRLKTA